MTTFIPLLHKWDTTIQYQYVKMRVFQLILGMLEKFTLGELLKHTVTTRKILNLQGKLRLYAVFFAITE